MWSVWTLEARVQEPSKHYWRGVVAPRSTAPRVAGVQAGVGGSVATTPCPACCVASLSWWISCHMPSCVPRWRRWEIRGRRLGSWAQGLAPGGVVVCILGDYSGATNELKKRTVNCLCHELKKRMVTIRIIWSAPVWRQYLWRLARNDIFSVIPRLLFFSWKRNMGVFGSHFV
jgi:hypothetical protein